MKRALILTTVMACWALLAGVGSVFGATRIADTNVSFWGIAWSSRDQIVYTDYGNRSLRSVNVDGTGDQMLVQHDSNNYYNPSFPADGSKLFFGLWWPQQILRMDPNGTDMTVVGTGAFPSVSADGTKLVHSTFSTKEVWVLDLVAGTDNLIRTITSTTAPNYVPSLGFSPDRTKIVVSDYRHIYQMNSDGSNLTVTLSGMPDGHNINTVAYSPDGSKILYSVTNDGIWVINSDGTGNMKLKARTGTAIPSFPAWSPDGTQMAYSGDPVADAYGIYIDSAAPDVAPPTGSVLINGGAINTTSTAVTLTLSAIDASNPISGVLLSNSPSFSGPTWQSYRTTKFWGVEAGDGVKTVYARFSDGVGNVSDIYTDTIILDTSVGSYYGLSINDGALFTNSRAVTLTISAYHGTSQMIISNDGGFGGASWEPYASHKAWTLSALGPTAIVYAKFMDVSGAVSGLYLDDIMLAGIVSGQIDLQGRQQRGGATVTLTGARGFFTGTTTSDGALYMPYVPQSSYTALISMPGYLSAQRTGVVVSDGVTTTLPTVTLLGGDAIGDNVIDIYDLTALGAAFGTAAGAADINGDGAVNVFDLVMVGANFGRSSPTPW